MNILVCVKRVPDTGAKLLLSEDERSVDTRRLGFTISPHEECAVEEAVQVIEREGGEGVVLTLGPSEAEEQLLDSLARGMDRAILLEIEGEEWDPERTADAIVGSVRREADAGHAYDLIMFGNESADSGGFQVGVRVAHALGLPCVTGIKGIEISGGTLEAKREIAAGWEVYEVPLPAVVTTKEGLNLPRFPSLRGTMGAKKKPFDRSSPSHDEGGLRLQRLSQPPDQGKEVEILGEGPAAAPRIVELLEKLELLG
jgi:electron transfer flavoprotein beta subunit